jgi:hypothetical protein
MFALLVRFPIMTFSRKKWRRPWCCPTTSTTDLPRTSRAQRSVLGGTTTCPRQGCTFAGQIII